MIGLEKDTVKIVAYKKFWKELYEKEAANIESQLAPMGIKLEHIGSTAVPDLAAKPILDIMLGVKTMQDADACIGLLKQIGYEFKGELGIPNRYFFVKEDGNKRTHHLHLVTYDSTFWTDHILFRDYLVENHTVKRDYELLKKKLAKTYPDEREKYTDSKSEFILGVVEKAKEKDNE
jgi:GrpB-like predicted nucleotidyltransferase (UPF0157 family)